jgi:IS605 OrfB family transposase
VQAAKNLRNSRQDWLHKLSTELIRQVGFIVMEKDLNVRDMKANKRLSKALGDVEMREFKRRLEYKASMVYG